MVCPKCNKNITVSRGNIREEDGGIMLEVECSSCNSTFEAFNTPGDFEEVYDA